jgi:predicted AlkP superfamily pyrophosphatase or phosphodiesterase
MRVGVRSVAGVLGRNVCRDSAVAPLGYDTRTMLTDPVRRRVTGSALSALSALSPLSALAVLLALVAAPPAARVLSASASTSASISTPASGGAPSATSARSAQSVSPARSAALRRHLLIVVDGLRPDYVTADVMPNLTALGKRGVVFRHHHSVYPTVTRVNASSIATGAYPETHGLLGNTVFFPKVDAAKFLDTADRASLLKIADAEGRLLTAPTLAESLQAAGRKLLVVSSGSSGSAFLNNPTLAGGAILHPQFVMPESLSEEMKTLGPSPGAHGSGNATDHYAVDAFLKVGLPRLDPSVTVMWLGDLDATAHDKGIGDPATVDVLKQVDREIKRAEDGLRAAGLFDSYDIWVTSDHGFSTHTGGIDLATLLKPFARSLPDGSPRIVTSGGAIYVRDDDEPTVSAITAALQHTSGVGAIFTRAEKPGPTSLDGHVPGTLSLDAARGTHPRAAQILFSPDWTDAPNAHGMKGTTSSNGTAGHGSSSPWDIHNTLIAAGPDLKPGLTVDAPSANVDFAPTFLKLLGLPIPASVEGRPLDEALVGNKPLPASAVRTMEHTVSTGDAGYTVTATFSIISVGDREYRYLDSARAVRK